MKTNHILSAYLPLRMPERDVSTSLRAPLSVSHWANSKPKPPRPPVMMYEREAGKKVRQIAGIERGEAAGIVLLVSSERTWGQSREKQLAQ